MDARTERAGRNEAVFREVNERINDVTRENAAEYLCECANATCTETILGTQEDAGSSPVAPLFPPITSFWGDADMGPVPETPGLWAAES